MVIGGGMMRSQLGDQGSGADAPRAWDSSALRTRHAPTSAPFKSH